MIWVISQRSGRIVVGPTAIVFASSLAAIVAVISGAWPAATSRTPDDAIRQASAAKGSSAGHVGSAVLVAAQVAIVVVLLGEPARPCARWWIHARHQLRPCASPSRRSTCRPGAIRPGRSVALYERLRAEVARESAVEGSTISLIPTGPPPTSGMSTRIDAEDLRGGDREVLTHSVASDYFATLKMPLVRGRTWTAADDVQTVAVINETLARQLRPNENPIGRHIRDRSFTERRPEWVLNAPGRDGWFEVIGVVRDAPNRLREPIAPALYYPHTEALSDVAVLIVRTKEATWGRA